jgi:hypothetical protein
LFIYKKLGKFTYNIVANEKDIKPYLSKWIGKEWKKDIEEFPDQPWSYEWLEILDKSNFVLTKCRIEDIQLRQDLVNYKNESYCFLEELKERAELMEESILRGSSIEPLLVNGENMELLDGYTRYTVLKKHNQYLMYIYLGKKKS